jgi:hypothetical protein
METEMRVFGVAWFKIGIYVGGGSRLNLDSLMIGTNPTQLV